MADLIKFGIAVIGGLSMYIATNLLGTNATFSAVSSLATAIAGYAILGQWVVTGLEEFSKWWNERSK